MSFATNDYRQLGFILRFPLLGVELLERPKDKRQLLFKDCIELALDTEKLLQRKRRDCKETHFRNTITINEDPLRETSVFLLVS
jgi:hypothetical protein